MRKHHTAKRHAGGVLVTVGREPAEVLLDLAEAEAIAAASGAPNHPNPPGSGTSSTG